jgi:hypothetical protein
MSDDWPETGDARGLAAVGGPHAAAAPECDRCGVGIDRGEFCEGCHETLTRRRAQP